MSPRELSALSDCDFGKLRRREFRSALREALRRPLAPPPDSSLPFKPSLCLPAAREPTHAWKGRAAAMPLVYSFVARTSGGEVVVMADHSEYQGNFGVVAIQARPAGPR